MEEVNPHRSLSPSIFSLSPLQVEREAAMTMKGSCPALRLSLVLLAAWLALALGQTNDDFLKRHWDNPKTSAPCLPAYCYTATGVRGIPHQDTVFIHEPVATIQDICKDKKEGEETSNNPLKLTECTFKVGIASGKESNSKITVECKDNLPVKFVKVA
ncbi:ribonuclease homolog [Carettochelys insculpta]|uniref:ribonuclease homolog n=1 Tax=Carettochelys insculpta TaxID=44489 RepID=UPI003EBFB71E